MVRRVVDTSAANIEDACADAWLALLRYDPERRPSIRGWLVIVAIQEAVRRDRLDCGLFGATAFVCALRGTTRVADSYRVARELEVRDTLFASCALEEKLCWSWLSTRALRVAIVLLAL